MKLIIVRHGETEENITKTVQGHRHGKLTETGTIQAKKLALRLKDEKIDAIYSSDLGRCKQTAAEILRFHNVPVRYTDELRERNLGVFEGRHRDVLHGAVEKSGLPRAHFKPEGGESFLDLKARVQIFLDRLIGLYKGKTVLLVTHGGVVKMLLGILLKKPIEEALELKPANASITIIEIGEKEHIAHLVNSTEHLCD